MSDVDDLVAALVRDSDRLRLPPPSALRATGDARTRRHVIAVVSVAVLVFAVLGGAGLALAAGRPQPEPGTPPPLSAPVLPTNPALPTTPVPPSAPTPSASPTIAAPVACTAADLVFLHSGQGFGMGSLFITYVVRNSGALACQLRGAPHLLADGAPVTSTYADGGDTVLVPSGGQASFMIREANGYGGYDPGSPECAHPATYRNLAVVLANGSTVALGDSQILVQCGGIDTAVWSLA
jgi:hypothetical protein